MAGEELTPMMRQYRRIKAELPDGVILLWTDSKNPNITHAKVAKNRQGKIGAVHLLFDRDRQTFRPLAGGGFKTPAGAAARPPAYWDGEVYEDDEP